MVAEFLVDCCYMDDFQEVAKRYQIPIRKGEEVIETNNAKYNPETFIKVRGNPNA